MKSEAMTLSNADQSDAFSSSLMSIGKERASQPPHIILVDDDDLFRESLGLNLIDEGYIVTSFSNGAPALDFFASGAHADVVLLDWRVPGMNGLEVLRRKRRAGTPTPGIFLTLLCDDTYDEV